MKMDNSNTELTDLYRLMYTIRYFEERLLELFSKGFLNGTTHTYIGQEANAVGIIDNLIPSKDIIFSNHRGHGHYISFTDDIDGLLFEIMGLKTGICSGKGGSQHLCNKNFYTNGIQGGIVPITVGMSFAEKVNRTNSVSTVFIGDGTLGEGVVYESFNIASLWNLPVLFVIENNHYAQTTHSSLQIAGSISARPEAFGIDTTLLETTNVMEIKFESGKIIDTIRKNGRPHCLIINTYRFAPHSKGDDYRNSSEIEEYKKKDPLLVFRNTFVDIAYEQVHYEIKKRINESVKKGIQQQNELS